MGCVRVKVRVRVTVKVTVTVREGNLLITLASGLVFENLTKVNTSTGSVIVLLSVLGLGSELRVWLV